jgi:hypothetical protein
MKPAASRSRVGPRNVTLYQLVRSADVFQCPSVSRDLTVDKFGGRRSYTVCVRRTVANTASLEAHEAAR